MPLNNLKLPRETAATRQAALVAANATVPRAATTLAQRCYALPFQAQQPANLTVSTPSLGSFYSAQHKDVCAAAHNVHCMIHTSQNTNGCATLRACAKTGTGLHLFFTDATPHKIL